MIIVVVVMIGDEGGGGYGYKYGDCGDVTLQTVIISHVQPQHSTQSSSSTTT